MQGHVSLLKESGHNTEIVQVLQLYLKAFEVILGQSNLTEIASNLNVKQSMNLAKNFSKKISDKRLRRSLARVFRINTQISFNSGREWGNLNISGQKLNLNILSNELAAPLTTSKDAFGVLVGVGNLGKSLKKNSENWGTFTSNDLGNNWHPANAQKGVFENLDAGGILVWLADAKPTNRIFFSWDYGSQFQEVIVDDKGEQSFNFSGVPRITTIIIILLKIHVLSNI